MAMYDTLIIGAGMSGLAAGIRLAHYDQRVCILERHTTIGGLNSFYRLDGRNFDVGLHAVTNYTPPGTRRGPLAKLLRQLRLRWEDFALVPQVGSRVAFPDATLDFNNDFEFLASQVRERFPQERDRFRHLTAAVLDYDELEQPVARQSARQIMAEYLREPLLIEMLLCPLMFYGNPREHDMDFGAFSIMYRAIFLEGFARPRAGVRLILKTLVRRYRELGGELRLRGGVQRIHVDEGRVVGVTLDDGSQLECRRLLSSAGWLETMRLCDDVSQCDDATSGRLSFIESLSVLNRPGAQLGLDRTIVFFNDSDTFHWHVPDGLADLRSGVICLPDNYLFDETPQEGMVRMTALASFDRWQALGESEYRLAKLAWYDRMVASAVRWVPDFRRAVVATDMFTPTTIRRYTGHDRGAVYGAPVKRYDGSTHLSNLQLCGTDQGFVGIIGAMVSGVMMANRQLALTE